LKRLSFQNSRLSAHIWGQCYEHSLLRFLPIFRRNVFLKVECFDRLFCKISCSWNEKLQYLSQIVLGIFFIIRLTLG
jgi:hypothetical protein